MAACPTVPVVNTIKFIYSNVILDSITIVTFLTVCVSKYVQRIFCYSEFLLVLFIIYTVYKNHCDGRIADYCLLVCWAAARRFYKRRADVVFAIYIAVVHAWNFFSDQWRL
jgi:hypothetical protein